MALISSNSFTLITTITATLILLLHLLPACYCVDDDNGTSSSVQLPESDVDLVEFPLNLEYFEAEFFLWGALGRGLDSFAPNLTFGGPSPVGVKLAKLDRFTRDIITQFAFQEIGHIRAIRNTVKGFPRPLMNLSAELFGLMMDQAVGIRLIPPFDPYANEVNYLLTAYIIPYLGLTGYVGANPKLECQPAKKLVAGLLGVESGQDAVIRTLLYIRRRQMVRPYRITVAEFTERISELRNRLGGGGLKDEGIIVAPSRGAESSIPGNVLVGDEDSLAFNRTPEEILRFVYGTGDEKAVGGFYPQGAGGRIARSFLKKIIRENKV